MQRQFAFVVIMLIAASAVWAHGGDGEETRITGEVLDLACYVAHEAKGEAHAKCAEQCVKGGQPMGLLTAEGKVYLLVANHSDSSAFDQTKTFAGQVVEIRGKVSSRAGIDALEVAEVKKV